MRPAAIAVGTGERNGHIVPEAVRPLLGPCWLVEGEYPKLYEEILGQVGAAVGAENIIDWLLTKDRPY
jgi:hypothetical protein